MGTAVLVGLIMLIAPTTSTAVAVNTHQRASIGATQPRANQHPFRAQHAHAEMHQEASPHLDLAAHLTNSTITPHFTIVDEVVDAGRIVSDLHSLTPVGRGPPAH